MIGAHHNQEEDEARPGHRQHRAVVEGPEGAPFKGLPGALFGLAHQQHQRQGQQRQPGQQVEDRRPRDLLGQQPGHHGGHHHPHGPPANHQPLDEALFVFGGGIQGQAVGAGIIERHAHLQGEGQRHKAPVAGGGVHLRYQNQADELDGQPKQDVGLAVPQPKQVDFIGQDAEEDFDHKGDQRNGGKNADFGQRDIAREQIEGVEGGEVAQHGALGEVEQGEQRIALCFGEGHWIFSFVNSRWRIAGPAR